MFDAKKTVPFRDPGRTGGNMMFVHLSPRERAVGSVGNEARS
jgi:hypothetical protein